MQKILSRARPEINKNTVQYFDFMFGPYKTARANARSPLSTRTANIFKLWLNKITRDVVEIFLERGYFCIGTVPLRKLSSQRNFVLFSSL